jgi:hypothetical protein
MEHVETRPTEWEGMWEEEPPQPKSNQKQGRKSKTPPMVLKPQNVKQNPERNQTVT